MFAPSKVSAARQLVASVYIARPGKSLRVSDVVKALPRQAGSYLRTVDHNGFVNVWAVTESAAGPVNSQGIYDTAPKAVSAGIAAGYVNAISFTMQTIVTNSSNVQVPTQSYMWVVPHTKVPAPPPANNTPIPSKWYISGG